MKVTEFLTFLGCAMIALATVSYGKRGFILTSPKVIDSGSTEYFTITVFDVPKGGQVKLRLLKLDGEVIAESSAFVLNNINMWVEMVVPTVLETQALLEVQGSFSKADGYEIKAAKEVRIRHKSVITFIQTDKPIYKPGQTVRFRVLPMDNQLKPLDSNTVGDIWIEDSSDIRVAQWKQLHFSEGMIQLELPLSQEPGFGEWSIKSSISNVSHSQSFKIEKYVLPKFEVTITLPQYVMADTEEISTKICAQYTYGKNVDGVLKSKITYQMFSWELLERPIPSVEYVGEISGCQIFVAKASDLFLHNREFGYRVIEVHAEVVENGTGIVRNSSANIEISHSPLKMKFLLAEDGSDHFKPGLPFYGKLQVLKPDNKPAPSEEILICATLKRFGFTLDDKICNHFKSNKRGMIAFSIPPQDSLVVRINLEAEADYPPKSYDNWGIMIQKPHTSVFLNAWSSPSNSYLQIEPITKEVQCEKLERVKVRYTTEKGASIKFYHQVIARGRIVQQGSHQRTHYTSSDTKKIAEESFTLQKEHSLSYDSGSNGTGLPEMGQFILSFDARATMSPVARLLVYYVREDGEIVADARKFRISQCLLNKVSLHFRHDQQYPSTEAAMLLSASPSSLCGLGIVDKSVHLLSQDKKFDKDSIFKIMEDYDVGRKHHPHQEREEYCREKENTEDGMPLALPRHNFLRSSSSFADATMAFEEAGMVVITDFLLETRPCMRNHPVAMQVLQSLQEKPMWLRAVKKKPSRSRVALPGAPLDLQDNKVSVDSNEPAPKSATEIRNYFPETWLWEIHKIGESGEVAFKRTLPHTITEWIGNAICVHPKTGLGISDNSQITAFQPFFVAFSLPYSVIRGENVPIIVTVFNYLSDCLPIKLSLDASEEYKVLSQSLIHKMCVCGSKSETHRFLIKPTQLGNINITVYGYSLDEDDICEDKTTARLKARDAVTRQLLVEAEGFPKEDVFNYYFCPAQSNGSYATEIDLLLPENVVESSYRAFISVSGDLMGPALKNLNSLVKLPVGCGEQNMVLFTPNIFVLDYLMATQKITQSLKAECLSNMKTGYQRELKYRHSDGSYSAFGERDESGSLWLTAFVVKSFSQARRFINVDEKDLSLSTQWIVQKQFENGCFPPHGKLLNNAMKGGLSNGEQSLAPLTAYVLISLLESGYNEESRIQNAIKCFEQESSLTSYALALFSYATVLAKHPIAENYLQLLEKQAVKKGSLMYWEYNKNNSKSISVEIAGYYILCLLELEGRNALPRTLPVVKWVARQRNSNGGFISTQDTVIALQALAKYSSFQSENELNIGIAVESDDLIHGFKLEESNKLVTQIKQIPVLPTVVDIQAVGDGCAFMQVSVLYNVESVFGSEVFDLSINTARLGSFNCNMPRIGICIRYKVHEQQTNMVVLSVKMASGFLPDEGSLQKLKSKEDLLLKRFEVERNEVNFYFSELSNDQKCFSFFVTNELEIEEIKPASVSLYDYYQPDFKVTKEYEIPTMCAIINLPDVSRLPPLIIDTEDDIDDFIMKPSIDNETEVNTVNYATDEANTTNSVVNNETMVLNTTEPFVLPGNGTDELVQDSRISQEFVDLSIPMNDSHLENFLDVDHDLDFPEGVEGNQPVTMEAPHMQTHSTDDDLSFKSDLECPVCFDDFPENFTDIYCNSAFALKITVLNGAAKSINVLQDLSCCSEMTDNVNEVGALLYEEQCECPMIQNNGTIALITGESNALWNVINSHHNLYLRSDINVILLPSETSVLEKIKESRAMCSNDP